jgi:RNA polymerase sigma-70 factor (ECF subfamily)
LAKNPRFRTTKWSLVLSARARDEPGSKEALAVLCDTYWYPVYAFVRRCGHDRDAALDLTQGYFLQLLERDTLKSVKREAGKFRSFLLVTLKRYLGHEQRSARRLKRGGDVSFLSLDSNEADSRYRLDPPDGGRSPDDEYERQWARAVIAKARIRLRTEFEAAGKLEHFRLLSGYLSGESDVSYREVAQELDTTEASIKMAVSRLRKRYGQILRDEIARTVDDEAAVDAEVGYLLSRIRGN